MDVKSTNKINSSRTTIKLKTKMMKTVIKLNRKIKKINKQLQAQSFMTKMASFIGVKIVVQMTKKMLKRKLKPK